jgi:hypothetical protein
MCAYFVDIFLKYCSMRSRQNHITKNGFQNQKTYTKVQNGVKAQHSPGGSWNNDRTLASGVWNQMAATALYSPSPQYICPQLNIYLIIFKVNKLQVLRTFWIKCQISQHLLYFKTKLYRRN